MSYKAELQANNADLQTILSIVNSLPEAGSGGAANVVDETVTIASSCTNADAVWNLLKSIAPQNYFCAVFVFLGDRTSAPNNQFIEATLLPAFMGAQSSYTGRMTYCRLRSGSYNYNHDSGPAYDVILNAGDQLRMVAAW